MGVRASSQGRASAMGSCCLRSMPTAPIADPAPALLPVEFGFCGVDTSVDVKLWKEALAQPPKESQVTMVAGFGLAYQGFPWAPTPAYKEETDASGEGRRYDGRAYPSWSQVRKIMAELPDTPTSFHLNESKECPYVSNLLKGKPEEKQLMRTLIEEFRAIHIQVNINAFGVPSSLVRDGAGAQAELGRDDSGGVNSELVHAIRGDTPDFESSANVLRELCREFPQTTFIVPICDIKRKDEEPFNTLPFFQRIRGEETLPNLCGFHDSSGGSGKEPDKDAVKIPEGYSKDTVVGFTGGIRPDNAEQWLQIYAEHARRHGCRLVSDAQTGFRLNRERGTPVDKDALLTLGNNVRNWAISRLAPPERT